MSFTTIFLKAKNWQLFLIIIAIPGGYAYYLLRPIMLGLQTNIHTLPDLSVLLQHYVYLGIPVLISSLIYYGWSWAVAIGLQQQIPEALRLSTTRYKLFFWTHILYFIAVAVYLTALYLQVWSFEPAVLWIFIPLFFYSIYCMFYVMYFTGKSLKLAEVKREMKSDEYIGECVLIYCFVIGIWLLQPRINRLADPAKYTNITSVESDEV